MVALPHCHHTKVPRGALAAAGPDPPGTDRLCRERPVLWVHAVSVGEVLAVSRLVKTLDAALPGYFIAVSTTTRTGQETGPRALRSGARLLLPLDLPWAVRAYLKALNHGSSVLAET